MAKVVERLRVWSDRQLQYWHLASTTIADYYQRIGVIVKLMASAEMAANQQRLAVSSTEVTTDQHRLLP